MIGLIFGINLLYVEQYISDHRQKLLFSYIILLLLLFVVILLRRINFSFRRECDSRLISSLIASHLKRGRRISKGQFFLTKLNLLL